MKSPGREVEREEAKENAGNVFLLVLLGPLRKVRGV